MTENKNDSLTKIRDNIAGITKKRSSHWPKVENKFRKNNPVCASCGSRTLLNVHHKMPFHLHPELELEESNLITLCMDPSKKCHIKLGHGDDWKAYNPNVVKDVETVHNNIELLNETAILSKQERLYE